MTERTGRGAAYRVSDVMGMVSRMDDAANSGRSAAVAEELNVGDVCSMTNRQATHAVKDLFGSFSLR